MVQMINPETLIPMDLYTGNYAMRIDLAYARVDNLLFGECIYRKDARLWLHKSLADIVLGAAEILEQQGFCLILYDGLRTVEAQEKMLQTARAQANPHWLEEPRLLSPPGAGAHPRGMAIDLSLETLEGDLLDMGTPFDFLADDPSPGHNPAHRDHPYLTDTIKNNRQLLDNTMRQAATSCKAALLALPQEWWDFRLPPEVYNAYKPLCDADLPLEMRMTDP